MMAIKISTNIFKILNFRLCQGRRKTLRFLSKRSTKPKISYLGYRPDVGHFSRNVEENLKTKNFFFCLEIAGMHWGGGGGGYLSVKLRLLWQLKKRMILFHLGSIPGGKYHILAMSFFFKVSILMRSYLQKQMS